MSVEAGTSPPSHRPSALAGLLGVHAGDRDALVHAGRRWSYAELAAASGSLAAAMAGDGLAGERVALLLPNGPEVVMAAVIGAPDPDEGQVPVAFVEPRPGLTVTGGELATFLADRIAAYKIPVRFHLRDRLPLTASGKIAHRELDESG